MEANGQGHLFGEFILLPQYIYFEKRQFFGLRSLSLSLSLSLFFLLSNSWGFVLHFLALALSSLVLSFLRTVSTCFALVWVMHDESSIHSKKCPVFFFFFWVTMPMY